MKCPICNWDLEKEPPFEEWEECPNCDWKINNAIFHNDTVKELRRRLDDISGDNNSTRR